MKVLIIGGGSGGATAATRLRRLDEDAEIIMFERGMDISFANCGLPYYLSGIIDSKKDLLMHTPISIRRSYNIDVRTQTEVVFINRDEKTVTARNQVTENEYQESYDKLILAPGARSIVPKIDGIDDYGIFTVSSIHDIDVIKRYLAETSTKDALVIGGGYIGLEMAENLNYLGLNVSIVDISDQVLPALDFEIAKIVESYLKETGMKLYLSETVSRIERKPRGFSVSLKQGKLDADIIILAIGVTPDIELAKTCGLKLDEQGAIVVNEYLETSDPDIYACGDVIEVTNFVTNQKIIVPLAGPTTKQARIVADNISGIKSKYSGSLGSSILKFLNLTVATTGINEKTAEKNNISHGAVMISYNSHATYFPNNKSLMIKLVFNKDNGVILGAQVIGEEGADKRCDVLATAIRAHMTVSELAELELCYAPQYTSVKDPINIIGYIAKNIHEGLLKTIDYKQINALDKDHVIILDVRTEYEYALSHIGGAINIPLNALRSRFGELDVSKPVYIYCQTGVKSYVASCLLRQKSYDCFILVGGFLLYSLCHD